jgi:hypothetical protein
MAQPQIKTIPRILSIAKISQYMAANESAKREFFEGSDPDSKLPVILYTERKIFEGLYNRNSSSTRLRGMANYVYALCGKYAALAEGVLDNLAAGAPTVTGPSDASITEGQSASFTISVTSTLPYTIAWFKDGVLVSGETGLTLTVTPTVADDGAIYQAVVTSAAGSSNSANAELTVAASLTGSYYYGDTDYFSALEGGTDAITYNGTFSVTSGNPLSVQFPSGAANNKFLVVKYPASQSTKTAWSNTDLNLGNIPDQVFRNVVTIGSWKYIISRNAVSQDISVPMVFS